jgi:hypothetical protein
MSAPDWAERVRQHAEVRRAAHYAAGMCGACGVGEPEPGRKACSGCLEKVRAGHRERRDLRRTFKTASAT